MSSSVIQAPKSDPGSIILIQRNSIIANTGLFANPLEAYLWEEIKVAGLTSKDYLILREIIRCESGWEQFWANGNVKISKGNIGLAQINKSAHQEEYERLGLNPYRERDNIKYAIILYQRNGIADWQPWSGHCFLPRIKV